MSGEVEAHWKPKWWDFNEDSDVFMMEIFGNIIVR